MSTPALLPIYQLSRRHLHLQMLLPNLPIHLPYLMTLSLCQMATPTPTTAIPMARAMVLATATEMATLMALETETVTPALVVPPQSQLWSSSLPSLLVPALEALGQAATAQVLAPQPQYSSLLQPVPVVALAETAKATVPAALLEVTPSPLLAMEAATGMVMVQGAMELAQDPVMGVVHLV